MACLAKVRLRHLDVVLPQRLKTRTGGSGCQSNAFPLGKNANALPPLLSKTLRAETHGLLVILQRSLQLLQRDVFGASEALRTIVDIVDSA